MAERLWNSPELVEQFNLMAIGDPESVSPYFTGPTEPRHIRALTNGVDELLDRYVAYEHSFSAAALAKAHHKPKLLEASVERNPETGAYTFVAMTDKASVRDLVSDIDTYGDYGDLVSYDMDMNVDVPGLAEGLEKLANPPAALTRTTTVIFKDPFLPPQRITEVVHDRHAPAEQAAEDDIMTVYDFMNLGRMIEVDLNSVDGRS